MDLNKLYKEIEEAEVSLNAKRLKYIKEALAENNGIIKLKFKDMNGHNLIYVIKYGICRYAYRICIDSYPGYVVKDPITLIEWVQGLKPGTIIKIRGIFIYHFL